RQKPPLLRWQPYAQEWASVALATTGKSGVTEAERDRCLKAAETYAKRVHDAVPDNPEAARVLGRIYERTDKQAALAVYRRPLPLGDAARATRQHLGLLLARAEFICSNDSFKNLQPEARKDAARALQLATSDSKVEKSLLAQAHGIHGTAEGLAGNKDTMFQELQTAVKTDPDNDLGWKWQVYLGFEHNRRGNIKEALSCFEAAKPRAPTADKK